MNCQTGGGQTCCLAMGGSESFQSRQLNRSVGRPVTVSTVLQTTINGIVQMSDSASSKREMTPTVRSGIMNWIVQAALGLVGYGLILFLTAGKLDWVWRWILVMRASLNGF